MTGGAQTSVVYLNDDGELMYLANLKERTQAAEIADDVDDLPNVQFSSDGKTIYFQDTDSSLYTITTKALKKKEKAERIAKDVYSYQILKDGRVAYEQLDNWEYKLNIYEKGNSYRLARNYGTYSFSENEKILYYTKTDETTGSTISLYRIPVAKDAQEELLLKGASSIYSDFDSSTLVYSVIDQEKDTNNLTLYSCKPGGEKTELLNNIHSISDLEVSDEKVNFYYYVQETKNLALYDFVTDMMAAHDADVLKKPAPTYPYRYDYQVDEYYLENGTVMYQNNRGDSYALDVTDVLQRTGKTLNTLTVWDVSDLGNTHADSVYNAAMEEYQLQYEFWQTVQNRDDLRKDLKAKRYQQVSYNLYHYIDKEEDTPIATGIKGMPTSQNGIFLYHKWNTNKEKMIDIKEVDYLGEIYLLIESDDKDTWYQNVSDKESEANLRNVVTLNNMYVLNQKNVLLDVYDEKERLLQSYTLGSDSLTYEATVVDVDFTIPYQCEDGKEMEALYLFTNTDQNKNTLDTLGDFCVYKNGQLDTIAHEVYGVILPNKKGMTCAVTDVDQRGNVELSLIKNGKSTTINEEISAVPHILDDTEILYLSGDDLFLWNGKKERRIARDIKDFWVSTEQDFSIYSA